MRVPSWISPPLSPSVYCGSWNLSQLSGRLAYQESDNLHLWFATICASASPQGGDIGQEHDGHRVALACAVRVKPQHRHLAAPTLCHHMSSIEQKVPVRGRSARIALPGC